MSGSYACLECESMSRFRPGAIFFSRHWARRSNNWWWKRSRWHSWHSQGTAMNRLDIWWLKKETTGPRYDRGPMYMCMMIALLCSSISLFLWGPVPGSNIQKDLSQFTQILLAGMLMLGSSICLFGAASGSLVAKKWSRRQSYNCGIAGMPAVLASLIFYTWAIYAGSTNIASGLGATLSPLLAIGTILNGLIFWLEKRRIQRNIHKIIQTEFNNEPE